MNVPKHLKDAGVDPRSQAEGWRLENTLKNVVIRRLEEIRALKARPSLKDTIAVYLKKKAEKDERSRVRIK
jgi:hypothetical protein